MGASDYVLNEASTGIASSADYNANLHDLEDTLLEVLGAGVLSGGNVTDGGGLSVDIDASVYLLGIKLAKAAVTSVPLSPSATNRIWAVTDPDDDERVVYEVRTDATEPDRAAKIAEVTTDGSDVTAIDASPAERNDITSLATVIHEQLLTRASVPTVAIAVGAEAGDTIPVSVQFRDVLGNNLAQRMTALCWLADAADQGPTAAAPSGGWTAGAGYLVHELSAGKVAQFASDATGLMRLDLTEVGVATWYLHVAVGNRVYVSGAITFA